MIGARTLVLAAGVGELACVQSESVGSDTGRTADTDGATSSAPASEGSSTADPYEVCSEIDTTGEPVPGGCAAAPEDSPCLQCVKLVCCNELLACPSYEACVCHIDCAEASGSVGFCDDFCAADTGGCDLAGCGELECQQACTA